MTEEDVQFTGLLALLDSLANGPTPSGLTVQAVCAQAARALRRERERAEKAETERGIYFDRANNAQAALAEARALVDKFREYLLDGGPPDPDDPAAVMLSMISAFRAAREEVSK